MISFRTRNAAIASTLILAAFLMLIGTTAWFLMPLPTAKSAAIQNSNKKLALIKGIDESDVSRSKADAEIRKLLWTGAPETVAPQAMTKITELARKRGLKLVAFRPAKFVEGQGLIGVPVGVTVDGTFPNTMLFVKDIEKSDLNLAVSTVQVASADAASDRVTGTVNVVAYLKATAPASVAGDKNVKKS